MKRAPEEELIFQALSGVETPEYDIAGAVRRQREAEPQAARRRPLPRAALVAACLAAVLAVGAAAVAGISAHWGLFFGPIPPAAVTTVGVSQTAGEYTLTLEDAVVDDNGALILLALTRVDGETIDPGASLQGGGMWTRFLAEGEGFRGGGGLQGRRLSEDGKTIYLCYESRDKSVQGEEGLLGKKLTFEAGCVAKGIYHQGEDAPISLAPLAELEIPAVAFGGVVDADYEEALAAALSPQKVSLALPLNDAFPLYRVCGAVMTGGELRVALTQGRSVSGSLVCSDVRPDKLIDTRTGKTYGGCDGIGLELTDGSRAMLWSFWDCPLTPEDLPYLELSVTYELDEILSEEPFSLTFTADSGAAVVLPLDLEVEVTGLTLRATELRLSALGLTLNFEGTDAFDLYESGGAPLLTLDDGSAVQTAWAGGNGRGDGTCAVSFDASDENGERVFFDIGRINRITFGDLIIPIDG